MARALLLTVVLSATPPAYAVCTSDKSDPHTVGSVPHGWSWVFCRAANEYTFTTWTDDGHRQKCGQRRWERQG